MERNTGMKCEVRGVPASSAFIIALTIAFIFIFFAVSAVPIHSTPPTRFLALCDLSHVTRDITRIKKSQVSSPKKSPWPNAEQAAVLVWYLDVDDDSLLVLNPFNSLKFIQMYHSTTS